MAAGIPTWVEVTAAAVVGLLVGSFLNVVAYRVPLGLSVNRPRSFCPRCRTPIRGYDNVPVLSWLALRGRCRSCRTRIAVRYPLVEAATGAGFAVVAALVQPRWFAPGLCVLLATAIALMLIDMDRLPLPASVAVIGTALGGAAVVTAALAEHRAGAVVRIAGGVAAAGFAGMVLSVAARPRPRSHRRPRPALGRLAAAAPALLPVGAWLGCLAPQAAAVGVGAGGITLVMCRAAGWSCGGLAVAALAAAAAALAAGAALGLGVPA